MRDYQTKGLSIPLSPKLLTRTAVKQIAFEHFPFLIEPLLHFFISSLLPESEFLTLIFVIRAYHGNRQLPWEQLRVKEISY